MKYRLEIGLIFFLLLFFISIDDPFVYIGGIQRRIPDLRTPPQYDCIASSVPETAQVLVLSNPDGTLDWNTYNFMFTKSQYFLAPRILTYREFSSTGMLGKFKWFLATNLETQALELLTHQSGLQIVKSCDKITVLKSVD
jgi:hypothetical protein